MLSDLYAALDEDRPWSLVRMGDGEAHTLRGVHAPWAYCENRVATHSDAGDLRERSLRAIAGADWIGWLVDQHLGDALESAGQMPDGWTRWLVSTLDKLQRMPTDEEIVAQFGKLPRPVERHQYAWVNMHMGIRRGFVERVLRREPLYLVGEPMRRWRDEVLRPAGLGEGAIVWEGPTTISTMAQAYEIVNAFVASPARVMFASLGVWALPVVGRAKELGRVALDWGHTPDHNLKPTCAVHKEAFDPPYGVEGCPHNPGCAAHWRYKLNTTEEDSPAGTMRWYKKAGAPLSLPEKPA